MISFAQSKSSYEQWLAKSLGSDFVASDLARKDLLMKESPFVFLRGTYWRWAERAFDVLPDLANAPQVLSVGDIHLENFGTWRDNDGRLVWGVNDFDEAATMPYALDLVRLATSAVLPPNSEKAAIKDADVANAISPIIEGYAKGLKTPAAVVLEQDRAWLRGMVVVPEEDRKKFWKKIDQRVIEPAPERFRTTLEATMPEQHISFDTARRVAGTGSLGRPRWIAVATWRGGWIVRESKAVLTSAWQLAHGGPEKLFLAEIAGGEFRAPDPWYRVSDGIVTRRLSPNNRKIEAGSIDADLNGQKMLAAMGFELANIHMGDRNASTTIAGDFEARNPEWWTAATKNAALSVIEDYKAFCSA
jgi:hypothetical protein